MNALVDRLKGMMPGFVKLIFSKRAVGAAVTAFFVTHAEDYGVSTEAALGVVGLVMAVIFGDSIRPINPDKS
tara:strand:+ start:4905 stop:5120 length:216 start_codon:yes stop_codon:yes gene_type:complete